MIARGADNGIAVLTRNLRNSRPPWGAPAHSPRPGHESTASVLVRQESEFAASKLHG